MRTLLSSLLLVGAAALAGCAGVEPQPARYPEPPTQKELATGAAASSVDEVTPTAETAPLGNPIAPEVAVGVDPAQDAYADNDPSALTEFREPLAPYGTWVDDPSYGTVWVPSPTVVGSDFVPYQTAGRWTYDDGYVWVSDYSWGHVPFHYGRWVQSGRGWAWIPGRTYSGGWVVWRTGGAGYGYVGWAPASPTWYWSSGVAVGLWYSPTPYWTYCPSHHVFYGPSQRTVVAAGPQRSLVEASTQPWSAPPRTVAQPSVATPSRTIASPTTGTRQIARPAAGPDPKELGVAMKDVPRSPVNHGIIDRSAIAGQARPSSDALPPNLRATATGPRYVEAVRPTAATSQASPFSPGYVRPTTPTALPSRAAGSTAYTREGQVLPAYTGPSRTMVERDYARQPQPFARSSPEPRIPDSRAPTAYAPSQITRTSPVLPTYGSSSQAMQAPRASMPSVSPRASLPSPRMTSPAPRPASPSVARPQISQSFRSSPQTMVRPPTPSVARPSMPARSVSSPRSSTIRR